MVERVIRAINATTKEARVIEGKITCCQLPVPPAGSHCRIRLQRDITNIRPSQNTGIEIPKRADIVTSIVDPGVRSAQPI